MTDTIREIQSDLKKLANRKKALALRRFFKTGPGEYGEGDRFLGIKVPELRKLVRKYSGAAISDIKRLLRSPFHEERLLALLLLVETFSAGNEKKQKKIFDIYLRNTVYINNWDLVDLSAVHIVGAYLYGQVRSPLYELARSKNLWERRISIISTFYFIRRDDFRDSLRIAKMLLSDPEDLMHKAVGWMLREVGKRDLKTEEVFLKAHYREMPRTMLRYAIEKFSEDKRQRYLKDRA